MALSTGEQGLPATRRYDSPRIALGAIRIGPALMLVAVVLVMAVLSPVFLSTRNLANVLSQTAAIAVQAVDTGSGTFLPVAVVLTLVGFIGTAVVARFIEGQGR